MQLTGTVKRIGTVQEFASGFQKLDMVLITDEQYPQPIQIEFLKDNVDLLERIKEGDRVTVSVNIRGREWQSPQGETKYFNSITGWKVAKEGEEPSNEEDDDLFP